MPVALFSLYDKSGLVHFAKGLANLGWEFLASGGTARALREADLLVMDVADYTSSPEILEGRVKTLHPAVAGGLLARSRPSDAEDLKRIQGKYIDLIACNLYPFEETISKIGVPLEDAIENIDIGGVTLLRAGAKNFQRVTVIAHPEDYQLVLAELQADGSVSVKTRRLLAQKAFAHTANYDRAITQYLTGQGSHSINLYPIQKLRYGENWHQEAELFGFEPDSNPMDGQILHGKPLSYNNLLDLDAAWRTVISFDRPTVCIVKHLSPCGVASADQLSLAYTPALESDPVSAFGSVIAVNRAFDEDLATQLGDLFVECIAAPQFTQEARPILFKRTNLRLLEMGKIKKGEPYEYRSVYGGMLRQDIDWGDPQGTELKVVTDRQPTLEEWVDLRFAWKVCQHVKSNAIVFSKGEATIGIGGGQPNRVDCVEIAAKRAGGKSNGAVMASDAFFPFPDSVEAAAHYGITAIIQPGGSIRDDLSIAACNKRGLAMVFTGVRHFRH